MNAISATQPFAPPPSWSFREALLRWWNGHDKTETPKPTTKPETEEAERGHGPIYSPRPRTLIDALEDAVARHDAEMNKRRKYSKAATFNLYGVTVCPNGADGQVLIDSFRSENPRVNDQYELTRHVLESCKSDTIVVDEYSGIAFASEDDVGAGDSHVYEITMMNGPSRAHLTFVFHGETDWRWDQSRAASPVATTPVPREAAPAYGRQTPAVPSHPALDSDSEPGQENPQTAFDADACTLTPGNGAVGIRPTTAATTFISPSGGPAGETLIASGGGNTRDALCVLRVRASDGSDKTVRVDRLPFVIGREPDPDLADNAYVVPQSAIRVSRQHLILERIVGSHITVRNHAIQRSGTYAFGQPMGERFFIQPVNANERGGWHLLGQNKLSDQSIAIRLERV